MRPLLIITIFSLTTLAFADSNRAEVLQIQSRPALDLVEVVRPLLGENGSVAAYHDKLIVNGSAREIARIRALLNELDRPARRLIIELSLDGERLLSRQGLDYGSDSGNARIGGPPPRSQASLRFEDARTRSRDTGLQRVQALEGRAALIRTGQSIPVHQRRQDYGYHREPEYEIGYRELTSGFYALPRIHGNQVTVEIYQKSEHTAGDGRFERQQASSVLRGDLGAWLSLGSIGSTEATDNRRIGRQATTERRQDREIELRVIALD